MAQTRANIRRPALQIIGCSFQTFRHSVPQSAMEARLSQIEIIKKLKLIIK